MDKLNRAIARIDAASKNLEKYMDREGVLTGQVDTAHNLMQSALLKLAELRDEQNEQKEDAVSTAIDPAVWDGLSPKKDLPVVDEKGSPSLSAENRHRYIIGTDTPPQSQHTSARLYREGHSAGEYVLAASGSIEQMRALAKDLTGGAA